MKSMKGESFDKAYISQQVKMHQSLLSELNQKFIPAAKDPQMKDFLQKTQAHVAHHLEQAQKIQSTMK
jgi:putative membrane protein